MPSAGPISVVRLWRVQPSLNLTWTGFVRLRLLQLVVWGIRSDRLSTIAHQKRVKKLLVGCLWQTIKLPWMKIGVEDENGSSWGLFRIHVHNWFNKVYLGWVFLFVFCFFFLFEGGRARVYHVRLRQKYYIHTPSLTQPEFKIMTSRSSQ